MTSSARSALIAKLMSSGILSGVGFPAGKTLHKLALPANRQLLIAWLAEILDANDIESIRSNRAKRVDLRFTPTKDGGYDVNGALFVYNFTGEPETTRTGWGYYLPHPWPGWVTGFLTREAAARAGIDAIYDTSSWQSADD